jgi:UDP-glucose 4-epimerase
MKLKGKTVCVTGGAGFIGSHLVDRLRQEECKKIIVLTNFYFGKLSNLTEVNSLDDLSVIKCDLADRFHVRTIFKNNPIDVVFNCAVVPLFVSLNEPDFCFLKNVKMTLNLCEILREGLFQTLIQFSSSEVYGSTIHAPMKEDHPCNPTTPYGSSKLASDHIALSYHKTFGLDISVIRPFNTYGPRQNQGQRAGLIPTLINQILNCEPISVNGDGFQTRDYVYVSDVVDTAIKIYENKETRGMAINIGSGKELTINEIVDIIYHKMMGNVDIFHQEARIGDVRRLIADITLAEVMINYKPKVSFEEGIEKTIMWYIKLLHDSDNGIITKEKTWTDKPRYQPGEGPKNDKA